MTNRREFCAECWFADLREARENLDILFGDLDALGKRRPLGDDTRWHTEINRIAMLVHEAEVIAADMIDREDRPGRIFEIQAPANDLN